MYVVAIAIGLFYIFAGVAALRAMRLDALMDGVLTALEGKPQASVEKWKSAILTAGGWLTLASGLALATLSPLAPPLFIANTIVQAAYLLWATKYLPPTDADEARGRAQTTNAFVVYVAATLFVNLQPGVLRPWPADAQSRATELFMLAINLLVGFASLNVPVSWFQARKAPSTPEAPAKPVNLRLRPDWQCHPLWDADTGENVSPHELELPDELAGRIEAWDDTWQATYNSDDPSASGFTTQQERTGYHETGKQIAVDLARIWPGKVEVEGQFH